MMGGLGVVGHSLAKQLQLPQHAGVHKCHWQVLRPSHVGQVSGRCTIALFTLGGGVVLWWILGCGGYSLQLLPG